MRRYVFWGLVLAASAMPSAAYAASSTVSPALSTGAGIAALAVAAALLLEMLSLRRLADGAAIAENISYAVLAVLCLAASVLTGWLGRADVAGVSSEQTRLGADLLALMAMVFFGIYFFRVRLAMSRFLKRLTGEEQLLTAVIDPDIPSDTSGAGE